ncbi:MAG: T9SS type A sorting domain-containing protein, partial [Flavobacteriaceae bacterium]
DVTSLGGASAVTVSDGTTTFAGVSTGIQTFGPYPSGTTVAFTVTSDDDGTYTSGESVTFTCPPANDDCSGATPLTIGVTPADNPVDGTVAGANADAVPNGCGSNGPGVWYSILVPSDGIVNIEIGPDAATGDTGFDSVIEAFSGDCTTGLTSIDCDDDSATGSFSALDLTGLTPGETIYVRVWEYGGGQYEPFSIAAYNPAAADTSDLALVGFNYYPNPVTNELTMTANETINSVSIFNMLGQEVRNSTPSSLETKIDMTNLANGTYFVKAQVGSSVGTFKVIKK